MKTKTTLLGAVIWLALLGLLSCEDEQEQPIAESSIVRFADVQVTISENQNEKKIVLNLSKPARQTGTISMVITSNHLTKFVTEPENTNGRIELPVIKGNNSVSFLIKPVDDTQRDGDKTLSALISEVSAGFQIGTQHSLSVSIVDDDESADDRVEANFMVGQLAMGEQASEGSEIKVSLSGPATASGQIDIVYSSENISYGTEIRYGVDFITEPVAENGKITLGLSAGSNQVNFKFIPINNQVWLGDRSIVFTLSGSQGSVKIGQTVELQLNITDDEPAPKIKSYETVGGGWKVKRSYEYGYDNKLDKITWEQYTPYYLGGTYSYAYQQGRLHKMVDNANQETYYIWEGDRIVKEEQYTAGVLKKYVLYNYDQAGNIGEAAFHYRQPNGSLKMGLLIVYLYYTDGNLYKKMAYNPVNLENLSLISTVTYENYLDVENPFPLEILPNVNSQPKLPGNYREEANGSNTFFNFTYELDNQGRPLKRTATSNMGSEVTTYSYR